MVHFQGNDSKELRFFGSFGHLWPAEAVKHFDTRQREQLAVLAITVGTAVAGGPPRTDPYVKYSLIRLLL